MNMALSRMGVGDLFIKLVNVLYTSPTARVRIGDMVTAPIKISRGTRQGCPLLLLLYAIVAEPLACALREYHEWRGIRFPNYNLMISSYADDTLLYRRHPETNLSPMLREVIRFGEFSGLKINWTKSIIFPLTECTVSFEMDFPLTWSTEPVRYLGIRIHTNPETIIKENYGKAVTTLEEEIERWIRLPLSLLGRISLMKMVVLPRFLFLFLNIPTVLPSHFFKTVKTKLIKLAWVGKQPQIQWGILTLPYALGGLGAPDLELYYRTAQCTRMVSLDTSTPRPSSSTQREVSSIP